MHFWIESGTDKYELVTNPLVRVTSSRRLVTLDGTGRLVET